MDLVEYHLQDFLRSRGLEGAAALAVAQLALALMDARRDPDEHFDAERAPDGPALETMEEQALAMLRTLIFNVSEEMSSASRNAVLGCSLGLQAAAARYPGVVVPMLVDNLCKVAFLHEGDLLAMKYVFAAFADEPARLRDVVTPAGARALVTRFLASIQSAAAHAQDTRKAALDLVGEVALIAGTAEMPNVVKSIVNVLEDTTDAAIHDKCERQLGKIFGSLPKDHPLVATIINEVETGLRAREWKARQRALTLFAIFAQSMTEDEARC